MSRLPLPLVSLIIKDQMILQANTTCSDSWDTFTRSNRSNCYTKMSHNRKYAGVFKVFESCGAATGGLRHCDAGRVPVPQVSQSWTSVVSLQGRRLVPGNPIKSINKIQGIL